MERRADRWLHEFGLTSMIDEGIRRERRPEDDNIVVFRRSYRDELLGLATRLREADHDQETS